MIHVPSPPNTDPPFVVEVVNTPEPHEKFRPSARIIVGHGIRDLARSVGLEAVGALAVIASFVTNNGSISPNARTLARALGRQWLRLRLRRLARQTWRGQPVLAISTTAGGIEMYKLTRGVVGRRETAPASATPTGGARSFRDQVIAHSRKTYARDKDTVEREITSHMGWMSNEEIAENVAQHPKLPKDLDSTWAVQRLLKEKVDYGLAVKLVKDYGADRVLQQVKWLGRRKAKNRARFLVGAIMQNYPAPDAVLYGNRILPPSPDK